MIKGILFDVDGVLLDSFESNLKFYQELFKMFGYRGPTREEYKTQSHIPAWEMIELYTGLKDHDEIRKIWLASDQPPFDSPAYAPRLMSEAAKIVPELAEKYPLGVVTGRTRKYVFEGEFEKLEPFFAVAVGYEDTSNHKPHPEPLFLAASKLDLDPTHCVYIGDAHTDMQAARAAGMKAILYGDAAVSDIDARITSLLEASRVISTLE